MIHGTGNRCRRQRDVHVVHDPTYARFTLADPTPQSASDVVGAKSGHSYPTPRRDRIHICRMTRIAYIRIG